MFWQVLVLILVAFRADGRTPRLAGGVPAALGEFPYLVASLHPEVRCTATIISSCWLLGAAHCYVVDGEPVRPCEVTLVAGVVDFLDDYAPSRQDRVARRIFIHPNFEEKKLSSSDLALIRVDPFKFDAYVGSIKLSGEPFVLNCEVPCYASGFGDNFENSTNTRLLKLPVKAVQSKKVCHGLKPYQRKNMLCLQQDNGKGLCDGDSGGPLVCSNRVVGVAHQVYTERFRFEKPPDMECGATGIVHTYMFTCPFLDWIRSYVPEAPPKPPKCFRV